MGNNNEALTLKELIYLMQDHMKLWWNKKLYILLPILFCTAYFSYKAYTTRLIFSAQTSFIIENQKGENTFGGLSSLLGSFGVNNVGKLNPFQIIETSKSHKIMGPLLFMKTECGDDYLAHYIIDEHELEKSWVKNIGEDMKGFRFKHSNIDSFSLLETIAYRSVCNLVFGSQQGVSDPLSQLSIDEFTGIFKLNVGTNMQCISYALNQLEFEKLRYIFEKKIKDKRKQTKIIMEFKRDSLKQLAFAKAEMIGILKDRNFNLISEREKTKTDKLQIEVQGLTSAYAELVKNYEMTDLQFQDVNSMFLVIDEPYLPLKVIKMSMTKSIMLGGLIGGFIGILFFSMRKIYSSIINE
jgi:hypothetical protein